MARLAGVVVPDVPHHVTQRGNRRMPVFLREEDYLVYLGLLREAMGDTELAELRRHSRTGRPLGSRRFVAGLENELMRPPASQKPGPRRRHGRKRG